MNKQITRKVFFDFLKRKKCFREYITECNNARTDYNKSNRTTHSLKNYLQVKGVMNENYIFNYKSVISAFSWYIYGGATLRIRWDFIHNQWIDFLEENPYG